MAKKEQLEAKFHMLMLEESMVSIKKNSIFLRVDLTKLENL